MKKTPPRLATAVLKIFAPNEGHEEILGDLHERLLYVAQDRGKVRARIWYWTQVLSSSVGFLRQKLQRAGSENTHLTERGGTKRELVRSILADMRYALRSFRTHPGAIAVAIISLGVGIGANVTIFSVVDVYVFRSLPFPDPDRLVEVYSTMPERGWNFNPLSIPVFLDLREQSQTTNVAASYAQDVNLSGGDRPERIGSLRTSWNYFEVFQIQPILGRAFRPEEELDGEHRVAVVGNGMWQRRFGSDPSVIGQTIQLDGEPFTIIGVLPPEFRFGLTIPDVWIPFGVTGDESRGSNMLLSVGRLQPSITVQQADADMSRIADRLAEAYPEVHGGWSAGARNLNDFVVPIEARVGMLITVVAAALVLAIACTNVANIMLTRATARVREIAVMGALGASRARIVRHLLTDSMVVAFLGGFLGILTSVAGIRWYMSLIPPWAPRVEEVGIDGRVLAFAVVVSMLTGIIFGIAPALRNSLPNFSESLKEGARGVSGGRGGRLRNALVVSEVTMALTLLVGSALLVRGFFNLQSLDTGWREENVLTFRLSLPQSEYRDGESVRGFYRPLLQQLEALPGVESAGAISFLPMQSRSNTLYDVPGQEAPTPQQRPLAEYRFLMPGYLETMDIVSAQGRYFDERDRPDTRPVVIVNEMLAELHWPNEDPIGKQVEFWGETREIVGVVENTIVYDQLIRPMILMSALQAPRNSMSVVLHTSGEPNALVDAVRSEVSSLDPNLPLYRMMSMKQVVAESRQMDTLMAKMMAAMAIVALVLSVAGVYGVISYSVAQRTQEMGIRMALGARDRSVLGLVLRQGVLLTGIGIAVGIVFASLIARGMSLWLFGVSPFDAVSFGASITVLLGASLAASYFPARRVAKLDPLKVLRYE
jgi:putative ABC transport system permease protein